MSRLKIFVYRNQVLSLFDVDVHSLLRTIANFLHSQLRMIFFTTFLQAKMFINFALHEKRYNQKKKMHAKDKSQNSIKNLSDCNKLGS